MKTTTLIGLGAMGTAIANSLLKNKYDLTVWNRSPEKMKSLVALGAKTTQSLKKAVISSQVIIVCISGYENANSLLNQPEVACLLKDKTIIQLSTGTPKEARNTEKLIHELGGNYLDASIMVYPKTLGSKEAQILVSGLTTVYEDCAAILSCLGGDIRYVGESIGAAAALDLAVLSRLTVITAGVLHGAHICEAEGVSLDTLANLYPEGDRARSLVMAVHNDEYEHNISASINTGIVCVSAIRDHSQDLGINHEVPSFILSLYQRAVDAGLKHQEAASLIKILRRFSTD